MVSSRSIRWKSVAGFAFVAVLSVLLEAPARADQPQPPPPTKTSTTTTTSATVNPKSPADRPAGAKPEETDRDAFRIGPLVGVGFPRPFALEGFAKFGGVIGGGLEYSFLPQVTVSNVAASFQALAADLRVFPFKGAFFLGLRAGRQWLDGSTTVTVGPVSVPESMAATTWFLNPRLGILYTFDSGFTLGIDAGVQLPISPEFHRSGLGSGTEATASVDQTLKSVSDALGNKPTPTVDLLRVGFLF
jgi:hypothetical protein